MSNSNSYRFGIPITSRFYAYGVANPTLPRNCAAPPADSFRDPYSNRRTIPIFLTVGGYGQKRVIRLVVPVFVALFQAVGTLKRQAVLVENISRLFARNHLLLPRNGKPTTAAPYIFRFRHREQLAVIAVIGNFLCHSVTSITPQIVAEIFTPPIVLEVRLALCVIANLCTVRPSWRTVVIPCNHFVAVGVHNLNAAPIRHRLARNRFSALCHCRHLFLR